VTRADLEFGTIPRLVRASAERFPELDGLVDGELRLSFPELAARIEDAARAFMAAGLQPGDRVGVWAPNIAEWVIAALGALGAGGVLVPLNTRFKGAEATFVLGRSGARFLCTVNGFLGYDYVAMLRDAGPLPPALEHIVVLQGDAPDGTVSFTDFLSRAGDVTPEAARARADAIAPDDVADIIFTSGTTGKPKGAMTTHAQTLRTFDAWANTVGLTRGDRYLVVNPFFHTFGYKAGILACLQTGAALIPQLTFDAEQALRAVQEQRITVLPGPPTIYQTLLDHPKRRDYDLTSLRFAVTGAAVVPVVLIERMQTELDIDIVLTAYGLTEASGFGTMCRPEDDAVTVATTCGRPIADFELRIDSPDDTGAGEVLLRGPNVMLGYLDDLVATAAAIDGDGWLHTGDIGTVDDAGNLRITDRLKDMYICGGFNVYPAEVEQALLRLAGVADVAVIGVPDARLGEVGKAFVVRRPDADIDELAVIAFSREHLANFKAPRSVVFCESLPRNPAGKVVKPQLREMA